MLEPGFIAPCCGRMFLMSVEKKEAPSVIIGVGVVARNSEGKILMKKRKGSHGQGEWALVGGQIEFGETPEDAALRELREETGIVAADPQVVSLSNQLRYVHDGVHCVIVGVTVTAPDGVEPENLEPQKCDGFAWMDIDSLPEDIFEGSAQILTALSGGRQQIAYVAN